MPVGKREARQRARLRRRRMRRLIFGSLALAVLVTAGYLIAGDLFRPPPAPMAGNVIDIAADMAGFDETEIRVPVGQPVTIRLTSLDNSYHTDGGGRHQWAIDELDVNIIAPPEGNSCATFTPDQPGEYLFYCDICCGGRANPSMQGRLIVES
ncbi:MAG: cupredoxin domain-containing protein [Chloroflexota bacterium]